VTASSEQFACARDRHLFGPGPKKILALDGGGVRGIISIAFLERIEAILSEHAGKPVRLGDEFDLVGGTSTGSLIAGAVALGYSLDNLRNLYLHMAPRVFRRPIWRIPLIQAKFDARALRQEITQIAGDRTLGSEDVLTGFCVVTKRVDTGSPWIIANNPRAPYWEDGASIGNKHYKIENLVRASTAAPHFFDPEVISIYDQGSIIENIRASWMENKLVAQLIATSSRIGFRRAVQLNPDLQGLFIDGGITPHNNPTLALFYMTVLKPFGLCWPTGPENLTITSIGTGTHRPRLSFDRLGFGRYTKLAIHALTSLMTDIERLTLMQMQWMGECLTPWPINSEIGTLSGDGPPGGKMFRFMRYDVRIERDWLKEHLGLDRTEAQVEKLRKMDNPRMIPELYYIGELAARKQVKKEHWIEPAPAAAAQAPATVAQAS
jgi:predicted acylesterase/phospholipase RssA